MDALRVAYLVEQCWHRVPGGTAVSVAEIASELTQIDDIELKGIAARHKNPPDVQLPKELHITHSKLPRQVLYEVWNKFNFPKAESLVKSVDLVHASGGAIPPTGLPLVATIHDLSWRRRNDWFPSRGKRFAEAWLDRARKAERIICPSLATFNDLGEAGFDEKRIRIVPLGAKKVDVKKEEVESLIETNIVSAPFVLWVGTIEPRKNLSTLVKAMQQIPEVALVLVGPTGWESNLQSIIEPISDRVTVIGQVDEFTKHVWYQAATVFCFPSLMEGFGLPVLEAMSHGTPVVTSSTTATAEVVKDAGLLADPESPDAIAESIKKILNNSELASELGKKGLLRAAKLTWQETALATAEIYREVLS